MPHFRCAKDNVPSPSGSPEENLSLPKGTMNQSPSTLHTAKSACTKADPNRVLSFGGSCPANPSLDGYDFLVGGLNLVVARTYCSVWETDISLSSIYRIRLREAYVRMAVSQIQVAMCINKFCSFS